MLMLSKRYEFTTVDRHKYGYNVHVHSGTYCQPAAALSKWLQNRKRLLLRLKYFLNIGLKLPILTRGITLFTDPYLTNIVEIEM